MEEWPSLGDFCFWGLTDYIHYNILILNIWSISNMTRKYDSKRRTVSAEQTRLAIVEAAIKLHGIGITAFSAVADEAGVALPTVTKHFPTREDLFMACTAHHLGHLTLPTVEELRAVRHPADRLRRLVQEVCQLHEQTFGQLWTGYKLEDESPVLMKAVQSYEALIANLVETLTFDDTEKDRAAIAAFVRAMLNPLTYRALRSRNQLSMEEVIQHMTSALASVLQIAA